MANRASFELFAEAVSEPLTFRADTGGMLLGELAENLYSTPNMRMGGIRSVKPVRSFIQIVCNVRPPLPPDDPHEFIVVLVAIPPNEILTQIK